MFLLKMVTEIFWILDLFNSVWFPNTGSLGLIAADWGPMSSDCIHDHTIPLDSSLWLCRKTVKFVPWEMELYNSANDEWPQKTNGLVLCSLSYASTHCLKICLVWIAHCSVSCAYHYFPLSRRANLAS